MSSVSSDGALAMTIRMFVEANTEGGGYYVLNYATKSTQIIRVYTPSILGISSSFRTPSTERIRVRAA